MNITEKTEQIKEWVNENKLNIGLGIAGLITVVVLTININKPVTKEDIEKEFYIDPEEPDLAREVNIQFVDPKTGEILGKMDCCKPFMEDMLECQQEYDGRYHM